MPEITRDLLEQRLLYARKEHQQALARTNAWQGAVETFELLIAHLDAEDAVPDEGMPEAGIPGGGNDE